MKAMFISMNEIELETENNAERILFETLHKEGRVFTLALPDDRGYDTVVMMGAKIIQ